MRPSVDCWSPLTHAFYCMTTSRPVVATQTRARVSPAMYRKVVLHRMSFLPQPSLFLLRTDSLTRTALKPLGELLAAHRISVFGHIARLESDVPEHMAICRHIDLSVGRSGGPDWRRSPGRPDTTRLEQFTSGTLEACHPPWQCCWSDATAPAGYATLMMMRTS